jgi:hypothetical protein
MPGTKPVGIPLEQSGALTVASATELGRPRLAPMLGPFLLRSAASFLQATRPPTETAYRVKAAKTNAPINVARAIAIRARKNFAIPANAETGFSFCLSPLAVKAAYGSPDSLIASREICPGSRMPVCLISISSRR